MDDQKSKKHPPADHHDSAVRHLEKAVNEYKRQSEENKNKYLRALADYQNFEKRIEAEKIKWQKNANAQLIGRLLGFLDNLDRAELFVRDANLKLIKDQFYQLLKAEGLEEIPVLGKPFDPYTAEVVELVAGTRDNVVSAVVRKGYWLHGRVIRPARVQVEKKSAPQA
ncbi:nucleotide exchange factor GrpE [Patescibacteria group bacterium]|nr:nucleotide exchange factor GrpE [Patescibacteria group bacterium]MCL5091642.1 nucleotide exchange factor GrpE [Patescibacteria group bacterium]